MEQKSPEKLAMQFDSVVLDCLVAHDLAQFYSRLLNWPITHDKAEFAAVRSPSGGVTIFFQTEPDYEPPVWPTKKGSPQMMAHLDFSVSNLDDAVTHALNCGAVLSDVHYLDTCRICLDPAGHPFCLCCWA